MTDATMNSATPSFPAEDAPQVAVIDNAPVAPPNALGTEMHQDQAAAEIKAQQDAEAAKVEQAKAEKAAEKPTLDEAMKKAEAKLAEKQAKAEADAKDKSADGEVKPEPKQRAEDGKFAPKAPEVPAEQPKTGQHVAPQRFHDQAKADWETVPDSVKGETLRTIRELEQGHQKYRADADEFSKVRDFHQLATQSGTNLRDALTNYVNAEKMLRSDPEQGLNNLLKTVNIKPMDAIQAILRGNNTTIQQLADAVTKNPQAFNRPAPQRSDPVAQQALQETQQLRAELQAERARSSIIEPFRAANPKYDALQDDIASILKSGSIDQTLPPQERLQIAYDKAEDKARRYAEMFGTPGAQTAAAPLAQTQRPAVNPAANKSISGAPSTSHSTDTAKKKGPLPSIDESLKRAAARR